MRQRIIQIDICNYFLNILNIIQFHYFQLNIFFSRYFNKYIRRIEIGKRGYLCVYVYWRRRPGGEKRGNMKCPFHVDRILMTLRTMAYTYLKILLFPYFLQYERNHHIQTLVVPFSNFLCTVVTFDLLKNAEGSIYFS